MDLNELGGLVGTTVRVVRKSNGEPLDEPYAGTVSRVSILCEDPAHEWIVLLFLQEYAFNVNLLNVEREARDVEK